MKVILLHDNRFFFSLKLIDGIILFKLSKEFPTKNTFAKIEYAD